MDNGKFNFNTILNDLQSEINFINNQMNTQKDEKMKKALLKQLKNINSVIEKLLEIKSNSSTYR
jgi:hypothetical protein